jgi:hypothetical protein
MTGFYCGVGDSGQNAFKDNIGAQIFYCGALRVGTRSEIATKSHWEQENHFL